MLRYTTDRARPGLVALYDVRPGNGAGPFSQPRSPHGGFCDKPSKPMYKEQLKKTHQHPLSSSEIPELRYAIMCPQNSAHDCATGTSFGTPWN